MRRGSSGSQPISIRPDTLPPYYAAGVGAHDALSQWIRALPPPAVGARLEIGGNQPDVYMAFGDSITRGEAAPAGVGCTRPAGGQAAAPTSATARS